MAELRFGVNYTPSENWFHSWLDFNPDAIARDLDQIVELGMDHIRIFPLWTLLQPNRTLIRSQAVRDVCTVVDLAHQRGLDTWVDVLQGHLSSYDFLPSWVTTWHSANLFTDPRVIGGQQELARVLATELSGRPGAAGMCVGNEFPQFAASRHPQPCQVDSVGARNWLAAMFEALDGAWPSEGTPQDGAESYTPHVHSFDDDLWFDSTHPFTPELAVDFGSMTTLHSWVFMQVGPTYGENHPALHRFARYLVELALAWQRFRGVEQRPVWLQEIGAPSSWIKPADAPDFVTRTVTDLLGVEQLWGVTWWCSHDVSRSLADYPELEYSLGLISEDGAVKPAGRALAEVIRAIRAGELSGPEFPSGSEPGEIEIPGDPARRAELNPAGPIFAEWLRTWDETGRAPRLKIS